jgi:tRNA (cmo5U34)-methyltransferase
MTKPTNPSGFFSDLGGVAYDTQIVRAVPPYHDMIGSLISSIYLPTHTPLRVLELGCGTGNLSLSMASRFTQMSLTAVDLSQPMLDACAAKLADKVTTYTAIQSDFMAMDFEPDSFDVVVSSLALHHLSSGDKQALYGRIARWLGPGGLFRCADLCLGVPRNFVMADYWQRWQTWASHNGASVGEIAAWLNHCETMDHYDTILNHLTWLQDSGFTLVDCYWRTLFWTVFGGSKQTT